MKLIQDLREFIELLNLENVQYLVIGSWAYNRYAEPRITGGIDFFVSASKEKQAKIRKVLVNFGYEAVLPPPSGPLFRKKIIILGTPPNRIDLVIEIDGIKFNEAWENREDDLLDGLPVLFISRNNSIGNKLASGRDKDLLDVKNLKLI